MNTKALFQIPYGMYLLSVRENDFDNACIINTLSQVTDSPSRISVCVNKTTLTHDMLLRTGVLTVSMLAVNAPFTLFERFGFQSGKNTNKFQGFGSVIRSQNGLLRLTDHSNAFVCGKVCQSLDLGSHTVFIADLTDAGILSEAPTMTYTDYHTRVKPQRVSAETQTAGYRCRICGYVFEGDTLPEDFVCPICRHGADDFEQLEAVGTGL